MYDQFMHNSLVDGEVPGWYHICILRLQLVWRLCTHGHQVVNFFHLMGVSASAKLLRKCASDTLIWVLQRGSKAEDMSEVFVTGRPLGSFPVTIVLREAWETERSYCSCFTNKVSHTQGKGICQNLKAKQQYRQELESQPNIVSLFTCQFVSFHPSVLKYA